MDAEFPTVSMLRLFLSNRDHISRSGYPFQPVTYLSRLPASCIALQKYHYSPTSCHRQSADTVFRPTRRVMYRSSAGFAESWRSHPAACPFGQRREFPRHPDYSVFKDQTREKRSSQYVEHENHPKYNLGRKFLKKICLILSKDSCDLLQPLLNRLL